MSNQKLTTKQCRSLAKEIAHDIIGDSYSVVDLQKSSFHIESHNGKLYVDQGEIKINKKLLLQIITDAILSNQSYNI